VKFSVAPPPRRFRGVHGYNEEVCQNGHEACAFVPGGLCARQIWPQGSGGSLPRHSDDAPAANSQEVALDPERFGEVQQRGEGDQPVGPGSESRGNGKLHPERQSAQSGSGPTLFGRRPEWPAFPGLGDGTQTGLPSHSPTPKGLGTDRKTQDRMGGSVLDRPPESVGGQLATCPACGSSDPAGIYQRILFGGLVCRICYAAKEPS